MKREFIATTFSTLETVLEKEIIKLGGENTEILGRCVSFFGDQELLYKANIHLRNCLKVLIPIAKFRVKNDKQLYKNVIEIDWDKYFSIDKSFAVDVTGQTSNFNNTNYIAVKVKDGIADYFRNKYNKRPSVDRENFDIKVNFHIEGDMCTLSLDSSGESLHRRGYRLSKTEAPLNEVVAAALVSLSDFDGNCDFIDFMCGSGTILLEAFLFANNIGANIFRDKFAFMNFKDFNEELYNKLLTEARNVNLTYKHNLIGVDIDKMAIKTAQKNISNLEENINITTNIKLYNDDFENFKPLSENGIVIINPPYGERLMVDDIHDLYKRIDFVLKHTYKNYKAYILTSNNDLLKEIKLKASKKMNVFNGGIKCYYNKYEIY